MERWLAQTVSGVQPRSTTTTNKKVPPKTVLKVHTDGRVHEIDEDKQLNAYLFQFKTTTAAVVHRRADGTHAVTTLEAIAKSEQAPLP